MKKFTFLLLIAIFSSQFLKAQCNSNASGFGNNSSVAMYNVAGNVQVVLNANNTVTVNLMSNFATAAGPDVRIFLVNRGALTDAMLKMPAQFLAAPKIEMGLSPASGAASLTKPIPTGANIAQYTTVYFYCQAFNQFWDFGTITTPFSTANCTVLSNSIVTKNNFLMYPNPAINKLNFDFENASETYQINIFSMLGSLVLSKKDVSATNSEIAINELSKGVYQIVLTDSNKNNFTNKFVKN